MISTPRPPGHAPTRRKITGPGPEWLRVLEPTYRQGVRSRPPLTRAPQGRFPWRCHAGDILRHGTTNTSTTTPANELGQLSKSKGHIQGA